jgi:uncharacterized repeat protein (TIGR01451 family)
LSLSASAAPVAVETGETAAFTFTVTNAGPSAATGVRLTHVLPAALQFIESQPAPTSRGGQNLTFDLGSLAAGQIRSVVVRVKTLQAGRIRSEASISGSERDANAGNNAASASLTVNAPSACAVEASAQVSIARGPLIPDGYIPGAFGQKGRYLQKITLRNTTSTPILSPLSLVVANLRNGELQNPISGVTTCVAPLGRSYLDVPLPGAALSPGEEVTLQLRFDEAKSSLSYDVKVLFGPGTR